jgi:hypothetical protein
MVGETAATSSLMFCFKSTIVLGLFLCTLLLRYPQRKRYCDWGHSFRWILKCRRNILWVKTESLFLKYVSTAKARCSTDQRWMATEMLWVSPEECSRTNSPRQRFHSQLFFKIVRYFCQTLYIGVYIGVVSITKLRNWLDMEVGWRQQGMYKSCLETLNTECYKTNCCGISCCIEY